MSLKILCRATLAIVIIGLLTVIPALATGEVKVREVKLIADDGEIKLSSGEPIALIEGEKVQLLVTFEKAGNTEGVITLSSDLENLEGLIRFQLIDYKQNEIPIEIRGVVPAALVKKGRELRVGEREFTLLTVIWEKESNIKTLLNIDALATNLLLQHSKAEIAEVSGLVSQSDREVRPEAAKAVSNAQDAWEGGNPELALSLCQLAKEILNIEVTRVDLPFWYLGILVLLALLAISGWILLILFLHKGSMSNDKFSIKSKHRW